MYPILKKILFTLDPETAHLFAKYASKLIPKTALSQITKIESKPLYAKIGSVKLSNPIGLAAGFDKNGDMIQFLDALGFGFLELGSITAEPCLGNPKPRIFRLLKDQSIINRMGLPNMGAQAFSHHIAKQKPASFGINIAKTPDFACKRKKNGIEDFLTSYRQLHQFGIYTVINLSCPNTNDTKTFEDPALFKDLAKALYDEREKLKKTKTMLVKLSPDIDPKNLNKLIDIALKYDFDGFVLTNTSRERINLTTPQKEILKIGRGGLSGKAISELSNKQLNRVYKIVKKEKILIGAGGIMDFNDLLNKFKNGATLVQVYSGFIYNGPFFIKSLNQKLAEFCKKEGLKSYLEIVGDRGILGLGSRG